ncbi:DUF6140 family protein [Porphyromonas gingivalis]|uniref:DUF6140 family protein n=1 Tax=Porphyromonas gingivalis TaxID=837 RepID=UPI00117CC34D|nr:DUF6140 family protein [Porphyromonas gingivalis]
MKSSQILTTDDSPVAAVEMLSKYFYNPLTTNGGQIVADAFMRIYGVDLKRAGALNTVDLDVELINNN